jgi:hypothetical protein
MPRPLESGPRESLNTMEDNDPLPFAWALEINRGHTSQARSQCQLYDAAGQDTLST